MMCQDGSVDGVRRGHTDSSVPGKSYSSSRCRQSGHASYSQAVTLRDRTASQEDRLVAFRAWHPRVGGLHGVSSETDEFPRRSCRAVSRHRISRLAAGARVQTWHDGSGYPGKVQYVDPAMQRWVSVDVAAVHWFDGRERTRQGLLETKSMFEAKIAKNLARYKELPRRRPHPNAWKHYAATGSLF